jgi:nicotinate phosphoribosyltransferase
MILNWVIINCATGATADLLELAIEHRKNLSGVLHINPSEANDGELAAMTSFAIAFPNGFMALIDTYDCKRCCMKFYY